MPNLRDIQEFEDELRRLGNEPEILRRRGEPGESEDSQAEPSVTDPGDAAPREGVPADIDQLLASLGDEPLPDEEPTAPEGEESGASLEPGPEPAGESDDFFIDDFLRDSDQAEESELTSIEEQDDSLFFQVPSAEELGPPEGLQEPEEAPAEPAGPPEGAEEPGQFAGPELPEGPGQVQSLTGAELPDATEEPAPLDESEEVEGEPAPLEEPAFPQESEVPGPGDAGTPAGPSGPDELSGGEGLDLPEGMELPEDFEFSEGLAGGAAEDLLGETPGTADEFAIPGVEEAGLRPGQSEEGETFEDFGDFGALGTESVPEPGIPGESEPPGEAPSSEELQPPTPGGGFEEFAGVAEEPAAPGEEIPAEEDVFAAPDFEISGAESFDLPPAPGEEPPPPAETPPPPPGAPAGAEDLGLDDIGEQFGLGAAGEAPPSEEELNPALAVGPQAPEGGGAGEAPRGPVSGRSSSIRLSNRDFEKIQRTLSTLPRNLRIIVEELIGERELSGPQFDELVGLLVRGASPEEIAQVAGRIVGLRIEIPAAYAKQTGLAFEEERATFAYRFRHNILPILRVFLAAAAVLALLSFLGYRFVYRPIHAYTVYATGYHQLQQDNFITADHDFNRASREWEMKNWYYRYAEGYIGKRQYSFAAQKYEGLLKLWPGDRKGIFDYANLESKVLGNYQKANQLLDVILNKNMWDFQGLLRAGDNYLAWGAEDRSKYELARRDYAMILQHYGASNEVLFRMLRYFILIDNLKQVEILKDRFQADPKITVDPVTYAELGGYLIDKNRLSDVHSILFRALKVDPTLPETNFNLARYFKKIGDFGQEAVALQRSLDELQQAVPLTRKRLGMLITTYDLIGENLYRESRYLDAQAAYTKGISRYEAALRQEQIKPAPQYGRLYADLGDVNYYVSGNFNQALRLYLKAEENGYRTPELQYREGYVYYRNQDYQKAMLKFYDAAGSFSDNRDLIYATANTLYKRNDYFAAEGYYLNLLNMLEEQRRSIADFEPNVIPRQHDLLVDLMKVYNNLGVTLNQLSKRSSDPTKYSQSLVNLTRSMEAYDQLTRNPVTKETPPSINLAFINTKNILYPTPTYELQIYSDIPQNMNGKSF